MIIIKKRFSISEAIEKHKSLIFAGFKSTVVVITFNPEIFSSFVMISFFTEKTFKPLFYGKPFVILGSIGQNTILRDWGFETFDDYFDLSQDANPDLIYKFHDWQNLINWEQ